MQKQTRFVIVGLGNVGLPLASMLSKDIPLVCIDTNEEILGQVCTLRGDSTTCVLGDATSRLVLEEAGICASDTVVISTTNEKVNIEVARVIAEHFQVQRMIALGITKKGIEALDSYGAEVESIFAVSAIGIRNRLELKSKTVHGIGIGKNEILEVEIHPHSRLVDKRLASIRPLRWHVGIIYRDGEIIVPRGETVFKPRDKVVLLGDPQALRTIADIMTFRFEAFPLEYGDALYVILKGDEPDNFCDEACYLLEIFPLKQVVVIFPPEALSKAQQLRDEMTKRHGRTADLEESALSPALAVERAQKTRTSRPGLMVMAHPGPINGFYAFLVERLEKSLLLDLCKAAGCPILLSRGTNPFQRVAVPCIDNDSLEQTLETALEIATTLPIDITAMFNTLSPYIASDAEIADMERMKKTIPDLGLVYRQPIGSRVLEGNPIRALVGELASQDLLAVTTGGWRRTGLFRGIFRPDVCWHVVRHSPVSTLLIPPTETSI